MVVKTLDTCYDKKEYIYVPILVCEDETDIDTSQIHVVVFLFKSSC